MQKTSQLRNRILAATVLALFMATVPSTAHATSKDMVELQTQVQQLLDMVQRLQSTMDTKFAVVQHLAEQTADNANQMTAAVTALQQKLNAQNEAISGKLDTSSGQVQSLNDSVDELKSRVNKLDKTIQDLQTQLQNMQQASSGVVQGAAPGGTPGTLTPSGKPAAGVPNSGGGDASSNGGQNPGSMGNQAPPLQETYQAGLRDYNAAKYEVASGEFMDVIHYYPMDDLAGSAQFYLGEIAYRHGDYAEAVKSFNAVLEGFSGSAKAPAAQLRKGFALLLLNKKESGIHELRSLIQRHPQTPEAAQAKSKLRSMNVAVTGR